MRQPRIFIALTEGQDRLEISGSLDLLEKFVVTIVKPEIFNPYPEPIIPPTGAIS